MKNLKKDIIQLLKIGYCNSRIISLVKKLHEPSTTIQYNVKQMEKDKTIIGYKAIFNYKKIDEGFCSYVFINLAKQEYKNPEKFAKELASFDQVESVDIVTGDCEIIIKVRTKDMDEYYQFVKNVLSRGEIEHIRSMSTLEQIKTEFIKL